MIRSVTPVISRRAGAES
jgi:hypothetical protein